MEEESLKGITIREEDEKKLEVLAEVEDLDIVDWLYNNGYEYEANILLKRKNAPCNFSRFFYHIF
ncbi:hypothetical protein OL548_19635 [Lysinibacillus sp. MHQ-1]|nr:hypothetical protein OL548_19635 [Lysinibacillus sp. MHQ-1]